MASPELEIQVEVESMSIHGLLQGRFHTSEPVQATIGHAAGIPVIRIQGILIRGIDLFQGTVFQDAESNNVELEAL